MLRGKVNFWKTVNHHQQIASTRYVILVYLFKYIIILNKLEFGICHETFPLTK